MADDALFLLHVLAPDGPHTLRLERDRTAEPLTDLLRHDQLPLNTRCGQRGLCDGCVVELVEGRLLNRRTGRTIEAGDPPVEVRACEHRLHDGRAATIRIPPRSLLAHEPRVVTRFKINVPWADAPIVSDATHPLGVAIDVGTTTVAALLVELSGGAVLAEASDFNHQMHFGDDVLTRINLCLTEPPMVGDLQEAVVSQTIAELIRQLLERSGRAAAEIACIAAAGNTTMLHLVAGVDPAPMGAAPFPPVFLEHRALACSAIGLDLPAGDEQAARGRPDPVVHLLPGSAAYVGADLCAGIFASGLGYDPGPSLLVDVGTNGEIIARRGDHLIGCATAAGPAFEGARLEAGVRASDGAIAHVRCHADPFRVEAEVIGDVAPIGLCGSAFLDVLAECRRLGLLTPHGRFCTDALPDAGEHFVEHKYGPALRIAWGRGRQALAVTEPDVASLMQAKAAIAAGVLILLERLGIAPPDIHTLFLAGGFGMHLDVANTIAIGLLPDFRPEQIHLVGNTALAGAYLCLVDSGVLPELTRISQEMEVVELNQDPGFEDRYIDQLAL